MRFSRVRLQRGGRGCFVEVEVRADADDCSSALRAASTSPAAARSPPCRTVPASRSPGASACSIEATAASTSPAAAAPMRAFVGERRPDGYRSPARPPQRLVDIPTTRRSERDVLIAHFPAATASVRTGEGRCSLRPGLASVPCSFGGSRPSCCSRSCAACSSPLRLLGRCSAGRRPPRHCVTTTTVPPVYTATVAAETIVDHGVPPGSRTNRRRVDLLAERRPVPHRRRPGTDHRRHPRDHA